MAMHDLDVYVATSMRDPLHFTTNWEFVKRLFHEGELSDWHLRYFDPTQAYLEDRIQKGLLECLMIKRALLTVYNAQETDTFGKDAEAGVTLAQRKPVIVYVARLFEEFDELRPLYKALDAGARQERNDFVDGLYEAGFLSQDKRTFLKAPDKRKHDAVEEAIKSRAPRLLEKYPDAVAAELIRQGYSTSSGNLMEFALEKTLRLGQRALIFRDVHPLSLQTSPSDGVARGVIVTRTVSDTARVVKGILLGNLTFEIVEDEHNWLLVDQVTRSPVRVVTKDHLLTTAFWSEEWPSEILEDTGTPAID